MDVLGHFLCCMLVVIIPGVFPKCIGRDIHLHYISKSRDLLNLVDKLPDTCQEDVMIKITERPKLQIYKKEDAIPALKQAFHLTCKLFKENLTLVNWDESKLTDFRMLLFRQFKNFGSCMKDMTFLTRPRKDKRMRNYFKELTDFLSNENYSCSAWEIVRTEILTLLRNLQRIIIKL